MRTLVSIFTGFLLFYIGEEIAFYVYKYYYQNSNLAILGIFAVIIILIGATLITAPLILKWSPKLGEWVNEKNKLTRAITYTLLLIFLFTPHITSIVLFNRRSDRYHLEQLEKFGVVQKIKITGKIDGQNSRHDLLFEYEYNGKKYHGMLNRWKFQVGDSALIIYSSQNPSEVSWYKKFLERKE